MTEDDTRSRVQRFLDGLGSFLSTDQGQQLFGDMDGDAQGAHSDEPFVVSSSGERFRVFVPYIFAEAADLPEWVPYLPKPGVFQHPQYGELVFTTQRNLDFVEKFTAGVYQTPLAINAEHAGNMSGAMAWIKELRQMADGSVEARVEWTERGRSMVRDGAFKFISPEIYPVWKDPATGTLHTNVAVGAALTTRPFFKPSALRPLVASESGVSIPDLDQAPVPPAGSDSRPNGQEYTMSEQDQNPTPPQPSDGGQTGTGTPAPQPQPQPQPAPQPQPEGVSPQQFAELQSAFQTMQQQADAWRQQAEQAKTEVDQIRAEQRRQTFAEKAGRWAGDRPKMVAFMERLSGEDLDFFCGLMDEHAQQIEAIAEEFGRTSLPQQHSEVGAGSGETVSADRLKELAAYTPAGRAAISKNNGQ